MPGTLELVIGLATAAAIASVIALSADVLGYGRRVQRRLDADLCDEQRDRAQQSTLFKDLQQMAADAALPDPTFVKRLQILIEQAGLVISVQQLGVASAMTSFALGSIALFCTQSAWIAVSAALITAAIPLALIAYLRSRRMSKLCQQLPEAFDFMARALRAGHTLQSAFQVVGTSFRRPISEEFAYCYEQQHLGIAPDVALRDLARRTGIMELHVFVVALIVQRRSGGNLAELLTRLSTMVRKRIRMDGRIKALTGEGRMQAIVLTALPPLVFMAIWVINRPYVEVLLNHPRLLYAALGSQLVGMLCIRHIIRVDI